MGLDKLTLRLSLMNSDNKADHGNLLLGLVIAFASAFTLLASAFFFWVFYERYLKLDFNELGRYYDAENQIVYTDSGFVWIIPTAGFLVVSLVFAGLAYKQCRAGRSQIR